MTCGNCNNERALRWKVTYSKQGRFEECDQCGSSRFNTWVPDVVFKAPHYDSNIVDNMGKEIWIESPRHKARLLRERGWREANDTVRGGLSHRH